ncbi:MAG: penicillin-binding protein activator LpoB [Bacteroidales bacterium]|nr:penicillin-binding protein activator LpoB [Bacteroidales bacterium]
MKKILTLWTLFLACSHSIYSNDAREIVTILPFSGDQITATTLQARMSNELLKLNRVVLVDKKTEAAEAELRKLGQETFMHANTIGEYGRQMGAAFVLYGKVTQFTVEDKSKTNSKTGKTSELWRVRVSIDLTAVDVVSGKVLSSRTFTTSKQGKSKEKMIEEAYKNIVDRSIPFLKNSFPLKGNIISTTPDSKGQVKELLINVGSMNGVSKGTKFDVLEKIYVQDGREEKIMEHFIGKIKVKETKGADFSSAIISGNKLPFEKVAQDPTNFIIKSVQEKVR